MHIFAPVQIAAFESVNKRLGGSDVGRERNIVYVTQTKEIGVVRLVSLWVQRVAKEHQQVDLVAAYAGSKLLIPAL